jgi:hypothetical protein
MRWTQIDVAFWAWDRLVQQLFALHHPGQAVAFGFIEWLSVALREACSRAYPGREYRFYDRTLAPSRMLVPRRNTERVDAVIGPSLPSQMRFPASTCHLHSLPSHVLRHRVANLQETVTVPQAYVALRHDDLAAGTDREDPDLPPEVEVPVPDPCSFRPSHPSAFFQPRFGASCLLLYHASPQLGHYAHQTTVTSSRSPGRCRRQWHVCALTRRANPLHCRCRTLATCSLEQVLTA